MIVAAGLLVAWLLRNDAWPVVAGGAVMFIPTLIFGGIVLGFAALLHFLRAEWQLMADLDGVVLITRTARGWVLKREAVAASLMTRIRWIEGDAEVSPGLRIEARAHKGLFIPAESFDCAAFAAFAVSAFPGVAAPELIEQVSASA